MTWDPVWEQIFSSRAWGKYPGEDLVRFVARNFYSVADRSATRILEVGSGTGANLWFLAREGFAAHGIDGSATGVQIACQRLESECPGWNQPPANGSVVMGDFMKLPWPDGYFDAVLDCEAVYCNDFEDSQRVYREMHRVTRDGGKLFVRTFATGTWGDGIGQQLAPRRYVADAGPMAGKGPSRYTDLDELPALLAPWDLGEINLLTRTLDSQRHTIREWSIEGRKI